MNTLDLLLKKYPENSWDWGQWGISSNPNLTMNIVNSYPEKNWNWC